MNHQVKLLCAFFSAVVCLLLVSCDQNDPNDLNSTSDIEPGPVVQVNSFPLVIGNKWVYEMTTDVTGGHTWHADHVVSFEVISDTMINFIQCKKVKSTETEGQNLGSDRLSYRYVSQTASRLDIIAINGPMTQVFFKDQDVYELPNFSLVSFNSASSDSVIVLDTALHYMKLPSLDGDSWLSNEFGGASIGARFTRRWSGYYTVNTDVGSFNCIRLDLFGDQNNDLEPDTSSILVQQYISPQYGLIKEIHTHHLYFGDGLEGELLREATLTELNF